MENKTTSLHRTSLLIQALLLATGMIFVQASAGQSGVWLRTASLNNARFNHRATLLLEGKVLVSGGNEGCSDPLSSSELFDPASGTWSKSGDLVTSRYSHTATLLPSSLVLVAGGFTDDTFPLLHRKGGALRPFQRHLV